MARRLNRLFSTVLSSALVVCSIGFDAQQAAAQTLTGRAAPVSPMPQIGLGMTGAPTATMALPALSLTAPSLSAPAALTAAPVAAAPSALKVTPAAAIAAKVLAAAPALQALAKPETGGSAASVAGRDLENILTGAKAARTSGDSADAVAAAPSALASNLPAASAAPEAPKPAEVPAAAPAPFKSIASASSYSAHRLALKAVAVLTGAVFTLPQAGAALTAKIIASAADKALVLSDFDDTLASYNAVLPADKIEAVRQIRAAGKHFAVISDRGDTKRPGASQLTVFESLESLPVEVRAGMYVAANSGGKVYRYDEQGVPQKVHEAAPLEAEKLELVKAAAAATKERLAEVGAVQHAGDAKNPAESYNTYGYALMLKPGSSEDSVRGAARILNEELAKRGFEVEVQPRFAKDPANPPYTTFSIITKADAAAYIAGALKIEAKDALVIGDAMFIPRDAKKASWLTRLGERLSGRPQVKTGNETDRNMTKNLPGVLALGVGAAMDPRTPNGWALAGHGPEVTQKVLESVASKAARVGSDDSGSRTENLMQLGLLAAVVGMGALGYYALISAVGDIVRMGEEAIRNWQASPLGQDAGFSLGATTLGMVGMMSPSLRGTLSDPNDSFPQALKRAAELAVELGAKAGDVRFVEATASMPVRDGAQWKYSFSVPNAKGGADLIYVDFSSFLGSPDLKSSVYPGAPVSASAFPFKMNAYLFGRGVTLSPEAALGLLRKAAPSFGAGVSVSLGMQEEPVSLDKDAWYRFYDDKGNAGAVNGRTSEVRIVKTAVEAPAPADSALKSFLLWLGGAALVVAIYGGFYWAASHAPAAVPQGMPEGWQGPIPTIDDVFRGMGGVLGLGMLAGTLGAKKAKVTDEQIAGAAKSVTASKGGVWSETEYNMGYYTTLESLKERGATKVQLELFKKLCDAAPVIGGRFNPWSGD